MNYRREIDGLRALAVLPVILFHAGFDTFSGGYVGVDVFFVISGYLITSIILAEMDAGTFSLGNFYERRARRILPALFLVMTVSFPLAWLWLFPREMEDFSESLKAVPIFASNVIFLRQSGYFETAAELKPLLHTWSLAVEEQFYVLFPLLILLTWRLGKRWIVRILVVVAVISLSLAHWGSRHSPAATFFLLHTRAWELAIGALLAFAFSRRKTEVSLPAAQTASTVGLLLILYAVFAFTKSTPFPSLYALVPTIGAALLIAFATPATFVGKLLGSKAFVGLGLISYSAYLWHQPLFAFARERNLEEPGTEILLFLSASAVALAYLSWRFVEQPFRRKNVVGRKKVIVFAISVSLLFFAIGNYGQRTDGFPNRYEQYEKVLSQQFTPHLLRNACDEGWDGNGRERDFCILGATEPGTKPTIAVFGDSHSNTMNPVFDYLGKKHGRSYVQLGLGGCPPLIGVDVLKGNQDIGVCRDLFTRQYEYVKENGIKKVFLISNWVLYTMGGYDKDVKGYYLAANDETDMTRENSRQVFKKAIRNTISAYEELGVDVIVLFQIPQQEVDPRKLYVRVYQFGEEGTEAGGLRVRESSVSFEKHSRLQSFYRGVLEVLFVAGRITLINLDSLYCDNEKCLAGDSSQSYYRDYDHPNERGALLAASILEGVFADVKQGGHGELGQGSK